jgi:hypothetical protein
LTKRQAYICILLLESTGTTGAGAIIVVSVSCEQSFHKEQTQKLGTIDKYQKFFLIAKGSFKHILLTVPTSSKQDTRIYWMQIISYHGSRRRKQQGKSGTNQWLQATHEPG